MISLAVSLRFGVYVDVLCYTDSFLYKTFNLIILHAVHAQNRSCWTWIVTIHADDVICYGNDLTGVCKILTFLLSPFFKFFFFLHINSIFMSYKTKSMRFENYLPQGFISMWYKTLVINTPRGIIYPDRELHTHEHSWQKSLQETWGV